MINITRLLKLQSHSQELRLLMLNSKVRYYININEIEKISKIIIISSNVYVFQILIYTVLGEREDEAAIAPGVFVTCFIKLRQIRYDEPETVEGEEYIDTEINEVEEKKEKMRTLFDKAVNPNDPIYAPYLMMVSIYHH